jgi:GntR family transcriptional regulator
MRQEARILVLRGAALDPMTEKSDNANNGGSPRDRLAARLAALGPGERLPAEPQLAAELEVSRPTLREALRSAEDAGLVIRRPGVGTVKTPVPRPSNDLSVNTTIAQLIRDHRLRPGTEVRSVDRRAAKPDEAEQLDLAENSPVWVVDRTHTADGTPVVDSHDVFPEAVIGATGVAAERLTKISVYRFLSDKGHAVCRGVASIHPVRASVGLAGRLGVKPGTLLLRLVQLDYDIEGRPVLLSTEHHRPDAFVFSVSRRGPGTGAQ